MTTDAQLLQEYVETRSEPAFGELVQRHIDLVYSAAMRVVAGDSHLAEDIVQVVFTDLARKASELPQGVVLPGWLHQHTHFTAAKAVRTECRRRNREQTALAMNEMEHDTPSPRWEEIAPHLDEGLSELNSADRDAIVLRFLKQQDLQTVGASLGISEDAAQKRVSRALDKLRDILGRRGIALSATGLATLLTAEAVTAAPVALSISVTSVALAGAATLSTGAAIATTTKTIVMTKLQLAVTGTVLVASLATPLAYQYQNTQQLRRENAALARQNESLNDSLSHQTNEMARLQAQNLVLSNEVAKLTAAPAAKEQQKNELLKLRGEVSRLKTTVANTPKPTNQLAAMLKDPSMKEFMKQAMVTTLDKQYGRLFRQLQLNEEQTAAFKDLLIKRAMGALDSGATALLTETDPAKRKEILDQTKQATETSEAEIKEFLGADRYAQYESYEKKLSDYTTISTFEDQLPKSAALTTSQEDQLLQILNEERTKFKYSIEFNKDKMSIDNLSAYLTDERLSQRQQEEEQLNRNYLARAKEILSPAQVENLQSFLGNQTQMQMSMMKMSIKMLAPAKAQ
jgi:RNA polymerase sigma factor (sigma-70 family)